MTGSENISLGFFQVEFRALFPKTVLRVAMFWSYTRVAHGA